MFVSKASHNNSEKREIEEREEKKERLVKVRKIEGGELLWEIIVKIELENIDIKKEITVEALLNSRITGLIMSSEFAKKKRFKLKKIERPIYIRNVNRTFNNKGLIEHIVEINIINNIGREWI